MLLLTALAAAQQTVSETVIADVTVDSSHPFAVAADIRTNKVFVTDAITSRMWVIDGQSNTVTATIELPGRPGVQSVNPLTGRVYVPISTLGAGGEVAVVDEATNQVTAVIQTGGQPVVSAVNPVTNRIYVTNLGTDPGSVFVLDGNTNTVLATVEVGRVPRGVDVNPFTNRIYVVNQRSGTMSVIDGTSDAVIATVTVAEPSQFGVGNGLKGVAVNVVTNRVYALWLQSGGAGFLTVVDGGSNAVIGTPSAGPQVQRVALNPFTNRIYVSNAFANTLTIVDGSTNAVIGTPRVGSGPEGVAVNPITGRIYVALQNVNQVGNFGSRSARRRAAQNKIRDLTAARERISLMERMLEQVKLCQCGTLRELAQRVTEL